MAMLLFDKELCLLDGVALFVVWIVACVLWMAVGIGFGLGRALVI